MCGVYGNTDVEWVSSPLQTMSEGLNCRGKISGVPGIPVRVTDDGPRGVSATRFPREPGMDGREESTFWDILSCCFGAGGSYPYLYIYISG